MAAPTSAAELKEKGNTAFAEKRFEDAESLYSQAIVILGEEAPHTLFGNRAAARLSLHRPEQALEDAEMAIKKDGSWLKGFHRKACAHQAMGEPGIALDTYRHAMEIEPKNKWLQEQVRVARTVVVNESKEKPVASLESWMTVFEAMQDSRERLSTLAHLWNQCEAPDRRQIFGQFLSLIAGAGATHTGVHEEDFTEEMMVSLPMDNYEDLKPVDTWMAFFRGLSSEEKVKGFKLMWEATQDAEKDVIVNDLRHFFLEPLLSSQSGDDDDDDDDDEDDDNDDGGERTTGTVSGAGGQTATMEPEGAAVGVGGEKTKAPTGGVPGS